MDNIRLITLKKKTNKRDLYKEILSSSSKVKDIIAKRKTKNKKFDYLDKVPKGNVLINLTETNDTPIKTSQDIPKIDKKVDKIFKKNIFSKKISYKNTSPKIKGLGKKISPKIKKNSKDNTQIHSILKKKIKETPKDRSKPKSFNNLIPKKSNQTKTQKKIDSFFKNKNDPNKIIKNKLNRIFNKKELVHICGVIKKCNQENNYSKIHYILRKINRNQTIQLLKIYNISKNKTTAPLSLLKNII